MPKVLVVQHSTEDGPARVGEWLIGVGLDLDVVHAYDGDDVPTDLNSHDALLVLGGAQAAYDPPEAFPWKSATIDLLRTALTRRVPTIGICLGGQLLAVAAGGRVAPGAEGPEIGTLPVVKRDIAGKDELFADLPLMPDVLSWHFDAITDLPPGATLLASSPIYANQAFRVGDSAWGTQFHFETTPSMVRAWATSSRRAVEAAGIDLDSRLAGAVAAHEDIADTWRPFTERFAELVRRRAAEPRAGSAIEATGE